MELKRKYSEAEITELIDWFRTRMDKLPNEFEINKAARSQNFKETVEAFFLLAEANSHNPTFSGQIKIFFEMREKLIADGLVE